MPQNELAARLAEYGAAWSLGFLGAVAHYAYTVTKGKPFKFGMMVLNGGLGFFVGMMIGSFLPIDQFANPSVRDGIIGFCGLSTLQILGFVENEGGRIFANALLRALKLPEMPEKK